jgi:hypothetical protein
MNATAAIPETASENPPPTGRRGRPPVAGALAAASLRQLFPEVKSSRGQNNLYYQTRALAVLDYAAEFKWLVNREAVDRGEPGAMRRTILQELGRFNGDDDLLAVAREVCQRKPATARDAVTLIRRARTGRGEACAVQLTGHLLSAVEAYLRSHPDCTWRQVHAAVGNAADALREAEAEQSAEPE